LDAFRRIIDIFDQARSRGLRVRKQLGTISYRGSESVHRRGAKRVLIFRLHVAVKVFVAYINNKTATKSCGFSINYIKVNALMTFVALNAMDMAVG